MHIIKSVNTLAFSLIEMMVTIAIIGVLAAVGLPAYQSYVIRSKVSNGINILHAYKVPITESFTIQGVLPNTISEFNDPKPTLDTEYMSKIDLVFNSANGNIQVRLWFKDLDDASDKNVALYGELNSNEDLVWMCTTAGNNEEQLARTFLPTSCKTNAEAFASGSPSGSVEVSVSE